MSTGNSLWSDLFDDLLIKIVTHVKSMEDFDAFRGVCTSWRAAATKNNFTRTIPSIPLLMLAGEKDSDDREFFSLSKGKIWKTMPLPEAKGKWLMESRGWLITSDKTGEISLLHPFSRAQIKLPNQYTIPGAMAHMTGEGAVFFGRAVLSANPFETPDYVVMVGKCNIGPLGLACWRPGEAWTKIATGQSVIFADVNYFNGRFYTITSRGTVWVLDVSESRPTSVQEHIVTCLNMVDFDWKHPYLVEVSGKLLVIIKGCKTSSEYGYQRVIYFQIIELNLIKSAWTEIKSLGEMSVFIGNNAAFSIDASSFPEVIKPNCIYFTDDSDSVQSFWLSGAGSNMGVYHVEDGKIEHISDDQLFSRSRICPPLWITPYF